VLFIKNLNCVFQAKHSYAICDFCCEPLNPSDGPKAHFVDSTCPMCNTAFWCSTFKQQHLKSTTCGAKLALFHNMLPPFAPPPMRSFPMLPPPYSVPMPPQESCRGCPDCVLPPPPPLTEPMGHPNTPTCNICGSTFADMGSLGFHVGVVHVGMGQNYAAGIC